MMLGIHSGQKVLVLKALEGAKGSLRIGDHSKGGVTEALAGPPWGPSTCCCSVPTTWLEVCPFLKYLILGQPVLTAVTACVQCPLLTSP